jgi:hypothetical protein
MLFLGKFALFFPKKRLFKISDFPSQYITRHIQQGREGTAEASIPSRSVPEPLRVIALVCLASPLFFLCSF